MAPTYFRIPTSAANDTAASATGSIVSSEWKVKEYQRLQSTPPQTKQTQENTKEKKKEKWTTECSWFHM